MSIRESIAKLKPGDPPLIIDQRHEVNYVRVLAKENGRQIKQQKIGGVWEIFCVGFYHDATLAWLKRLRYQREARRKWLAKNYYYKKNRRRA